MSVSKPNCDIQPAAFWYYDTLRVPLKVLQLPLFSFSTFSFFLQCLFIVNINYRQLFIFDKSHQTYTNRLHHCEIDPLYSRRQPKKKYFSLVIKIIMIIVKKEKNHICRQLK